MSTVNLTAIVNEKSKARQEDLEKFNKLLFDISKALVDSYTLFNMIQLSTNIGDKEKALVEAKRFAIEGANMLKAVSLKSKEFYERKGV